MEKKRKTFSSPILVLAVVLLVQVIIFAPRVGRGFVTDDLTWLENVVPDGKVDYLRPFSKTTGFFRPLVGISFGVQYELHGMAPRPYGLFNLFLHLLNIILVFLLLSHWEKTRPYALWVTILFALNAKGVNMAVGWISGRTTLLFSFFILLTFYLYGKLSPKNPFRFLLIALCYFAALLSKETAAAMPVFIFLFIFFGLKGETKTHGFLKKIKSCLISIVVFVPPLVIYFFLRFRSDAMSPFNAPDYYRYSFSPLLIFKNVSEYIIRAGLPDLYIIFFFFLAVAAASFSREQNNKSVAKFNPGVFLPGGLWFLVFLLPLLPIPARSDLYVYLPQVGFHLAALTLIFPLWRKLTQKRGFWRYASGFFICGLTIIWVGYLFGKAVAIGQKGETSARFNEAVIFAVRQIPPGSEIIVADDPDERHSPSRVIAYGFTSLLNLYYPDKKLSGRFAAPEENSKLKNKPGYYIFYWKDGRLQEKH